MVGQQRGINDEQPNCAHPLPPRAAGSIRLGRLHALRRHHEIDIQATRGERQPSENIAHESKFLTMRGKSNIMFHSWYSFREACVCTYVEADIWHI